MELDSPSKATDVSSSRWNLALFAYSVVFFSFSVRNWPDSFDLLGYLCLHREVRYIARFSLKTADCYSSQHLVKVVRQNWLYSWESSSTLVWWHSYPLYLSLSFGITSLSLYPFAAREWNFYVFNSLMKMGRWNGQDLSHLRPYLLLQKTVPFYVLVTHLP